MDHSKQNTLKKIGIIKAPVGGADDVLLIDNNFAGVTSALLTIPEVAEILSVSVTTVRRLQQQRNIPFIKVGGSLRFLQRDVTGYLQKQRVMAVE